MRYLYVAFFLLIFDCLRATLGSLTGSNIIKAIFINHNLLIWPIDHWKPYNKVAYKTLKRVILDTSSIPKNIWISQWHALSNLIKSIQKVKPKFFFCWMFISIQKYISSIDYFWRYCKQLKPATWSDDYNTKIKTAWKTFVFDSNCFQFSSKAIF